MNHRAHGPARTTLRALSRTAMFAALRSFPLRVAMYVAMGACAHSAFAAAPSPDGARVHVRGIARIDAHATKSSGVLLIAGRVTDDTAVRSGETAAASVSLRIAQTTGARAVALASTSPQSCQGGAARPVLGSPEQLVLPTDASGRFCVQVSLPVDKYVAHLEVPSSPRIDGTGMDLALDLALRSATLTFEGVTSLSLDDESASIMVKAKEQDPTSGLSLAGRGLALSLSNEEGTPIGDATTDSEGQAVFAVPAAHLGPPGRGELRVSFAGNAITAPVTASKGVERRTHAVLDVPEATNRKLPAASADDVEVRVVASAACAVHGCKAVPGGTIELRASPERGGAILGAAPLVHGAARVVVRFSPFAPAEDAVELVLRYAPEAPWFDAPLDRTLVLPIRPEGPWGSALLVVSGAAVLLWLVIARFPLAKRVADAENPRDAARVRLPGPRVEHVRAGDAGRWAGHVVDAHDGTPILRARVAIERPGFRGLSVIVEGVSDSSGAFALRSEAVIAGDELVVESRIHGVVRRPLPAPGEIEVALVQRRRLLLEQMVAWAKRRGRPFDARPEPTPAHVRRAAGRLEFALEQRTQAARIEQWAEAVETVAYSGAPVDAATQAEVERLGPTDASRSESEPPEPEGTAGEQDKARAARLR